MTEVTSMFVYFDAEGDIKSISPVNTEKIELCTSAEFPISSVEEFLTGKSKPHEFQVLKLSGTNTYTISKRKIIEIDLKRTLDSYLTEVTEKTKNVSVLIENNTRLKRIRISIIPGIRQLLESETDENDMGLRKFFNTPSLQLFFTKKHDPYFLLFSLEFSPRSLLDRGVISFDYKTNLRNTSLFTTRILDGYSYTVKDI